MSNGQSNESICSMDEGPVAPPRKVNISSLMHAIKI